MCFERVRLFAYFTEEARGYRSAHSNSHAAPEKIGTEQLPDSTPFAGATGSDVHAARAQTRHPDATII